MTFRCAPLLFSVLILSTLILYSPIVGSAMTGFDNDLRMHFVDNFSLSYDPIVDDIDLDGVDEVIVYILNESEYPVIMVYDSGGAEYIVDVASFLGIYSYEYTISYTVCGSLLYILIADVVDVENDTLIRVHPKLVKVDFYGDSPAVEEMYLDVFNYTAPVSYTIEHEIYSGVCVEGRYLVFPLSLYGYITFIVDLDTLEYVYINEFYPLYSGSNIKYVVVDDEIIVLTQSNLVHIHGSLENTSVTPLIASHRFLVSTTSSYLYVVNETYLYAYITDFNKLYNRSCLGLWIYNYRISNVTGIKYINLTGDPIGDPIIYNNTLILFTSSSTGSQAIFLNPVSIETMYTYSVDGVYDQMIYVDYKSSIYAILYSPRSCLMIDLTSLKYVSYSLWNRFKSIGIEPDYIYYIGLGDIDGDERYEVIGITGYIIEPYGYGETLFYTGLVDPELVPLSEYPCIDYLLLISLVIIMVFEVRLWRRNTL